MTTLKEQLLTEIRYQSLITDYAIMNLKHKFILLNAVLPLDFSCSLAEMIEAAEEFGCHVLPSEGLRDPGSATMSQMYYFFTGPTKEALEQMVTATQLTGVVIETQGVYDQLETQEIIKH